MYSPVRFFFLLLCCFLFAALAVSTSPGIAGDHKAGKGHFERHDVDTGHRVFSGQTDRGHDEGNETTGQIAAWSLAAANLMVILSLLIKAVRRFAPISQETKNSIMKFNGFQKKHLLVFHCVLNPVVLAVAVLHWMLSRCRATALPEWGLIVMAFIVALGVVLKFKLCPKDLLRNVYRIHTQPLLSAMFVCMLLIGHLVID